MGRTRLVIVLAALAALAVVLRRRRARPAPSPPPVPASAGSPEDTREGLRRFVEAGERMREGEQASPEL